MSHGKDFKWDVSFSLLSRDVETAQQLAHQLAPLKCFVYTEKQRDVVGRNSVEAFAETFRKDSRLAVVLWRKEYGTTEYTDLEARAIQDRGMECNWQSPILINLDGSAVPAWYPRRNVWLDLTRYPIDEAVGAIRLRSEELGARSTPETAQEYAERMSQRAADVRSRAQHQASQPAVAEVRKEVDHILAELQQRFNELKPTLDAYSPFFMPLRRDGAAIATRNGTLKLLWEQRYTNTLDESVLSVDIYNGYISIGERRAMREGKLMTKGRYTPTYAAGGIWRWGSEDGKRSFTSDELVESVLKRFFDVVFRE